MAQSIEEQIKFLGILCDLSEHYSKNTSGYVTVENYIENYNQ